MNENHGSGDGPETDRLPPPAFPHGKGPRRSPERELEGPATAGPDSDGAVPEDAFMRPGAESEPEEDGMQDALFSPDDPVVREGVPAVPEDFEEVMSRAQPDDLLTGDVLVTGMGVDPHLDLDPHLERWGDPHLAVLIAAVDHLGTEIRERGEAGLKIRPGMSRFEVTLRAYCVGYLNGLRAHGTEPPYS